MLLIHFNAQVLWEFTVNGVMPIDRYKLNEKPINGNSTVRSNCNYKLTLYGKCYFQLKLLCFAML